MTSKSCYSLAALLRATEQVKAFCKWVCVANVAMAALVGLFAGEPMALAGDAPAWMHALTNAPLPPHDEKSDAVMLYMEEILIVQPNGKMKEIDRAAYKILRPNGRHFGTQSFYVDSETRLTDVHGWCIPTNGKVYEVKEKDLTEEGMVGAELGVLYSDTRVKVLNIPAPDPGNIIGYEITQEVRPYILQDSFRFQRTFPVADARYTLQLPPGWEYKALWYNHPGLSPASVGNNQWHWELKNIPEIKREEQMPTWTGLAGLLIISLLPPGGGSHGFLSWPEMGTWYTGLLQGRRESTPEMKQKVAELTSQTNDPLIKMRKLAEFMQKDIRYVEISLGIGGWQPHAARDVFGHRYGDCKDKATLLSTMLQEIGVDSYVVLIDTHRGTVTPSMPAHLGTFDHAILAVRLPDSVNDSSPMATMQYPGLGRLLIFDPTDEVTPFGKLRGELQGSYALLAAPSGGSLVQMPQLPPATSGINRTAKLKLNTDGTLNGDVTEIRRGDSATYQRYYMRYIRKDSDRIKPIETELSHSLGNFQITQATVGNLTIYDKPLEYKYTFTSAAFAKTAGNLFLVRPHVVGSLSSDLLEKKEPRKYPVEFEGPSRNVDTYEIEIPAGYTVDELPPPIDADYSFASYHSKTEVKGSALVYNRTYEIKELSVPVDKLDQLKTLYRMISSDERNTAVLKAKAN